MKQQTNSHLLREFLGLFVEEGVAMAVEKSPSSPPVPETPTFSVAEDSRDPSSQAFASENRDISSLIHQINESDVVRAGGENEHATKQHK